MKEKKRICIYAKKALVPILALALVLTATLLPIGVGPPGIFAYATNTATISLVKVSEDTLNDTVVLKVNLDTVPDDGISLVSFKLSYPDQFEITEVQDLELLSEYGFTGEAKTNPYYVARASLSQDEGGVYKGNGGGIASFSFKVKDNATLTDGDEYAFQLQNVEAYRLTGDSIDGTTISLNAGTEKQTYTPVADNHSGTVTSSSITVTTQAGTETVITPVVKTQTIRTAINNAGESETVTLDASSSKSVALTKTGAAAIATSNKSMDVKMSTSELTFNQSAAEKIGQKTGGEKLVIETERIEDSTIIDGDAVDALKYEVTAKLVDVNTNESTPITSFGGGEVTVSLDLPNAWKSLSAEDKSKLVCWHYTDTNYTVVNGSVNEAGDKYVFTTKHFSTFALMKNQETADAFKNTNGLTEGVTVSGTVTSYGSADENVTIELIKSGEMTASYSETVTGNTATYAITDVASGNYTLKVSKKGHATWTETLEITSNAISEKDISIYLLGDVNQNGKTDGQDLQRLYEHLNKTSPLAGTYAVTLGDVNKNGATDGQDL